MAAGPADRPAIEAICGRRDAPPPVGIVRRWLRVAPESFTIARDQDNAVAGYSIVCDAGALDRGLDVDPVVAAWRTHAGARPAPRDAQMLGIRAVQTRDAGDAPDPAQAALLLDVVRRCLELRPRLRRVYASARAGSGMAGALEALDFRAVDWPNSEIDGSPDRSYVLDLSPGSTDAWLASVVERDLAAARSSVEALRWIS